MSETASIYVHLDWHIGHYVKVMLDEVFGEENFVNEVIWKYFGPTSGKKQYPNKHDNIYFYTKAEDYTFNFEKLLDCILLAVFIFLELLLYGCSHPLKIDLKL